MRVALRHVLGDRKVLLHIRPSLVSASGRSEAWRLRSASIRRGAVLRLLAIHLRRHGARAAGDQPVMLDAPMLREVEDRLLAEARGVEVTSVHDELVALALRLDDDLAIGVHDERTAAQVMPI